MSYPSFSDDQLELQLFPAFEETVKRFFSKKGVDENWIVGRGVLLKPPYMLTFAAGTDKHTVEITGSSESEPATALIEARRAVTGRFRPQITFMNLGSDGTPTFRRLVPLRGLHADLVSGIAPGQSISKTEFDRLTAAVRRKGNEPMTDGPRRWRELRTEYGFDVSSEGLYSRGTSSTPLFEPQPRPNMSQLVRHVLSDLLSKTLPEPDLPPVPVCNKCGRLITFTRDEDGFPGVVDHRRPVLFGGSDEPENLQLYCQQCNNLKAHICNRCPLAYHCERCTWAFPETFHDTLVISLSTSEATTLELLADRENLRADTYAKLKLLEHIDLEEPP